MKDRFTHIRANTWVSFCGVCDPTSSINRRHFDERHTKPAIAGQLERLPEPLCQECVRLATGDAQTQ